MSDAHGQIGDGKAGFKFQDGLYLPFSGRDEQLLWSFSSMGETRPILTVEDAGKWYELFVVRPNESINAYDFGILMGFEKGVPYFVDHCPNPDAVDALCDYNGWHIDERAEEAMHGRWRIEVELPAREQR